MTVLKRQATIRWLNHPPGGTPRLTVGSKSITPALPLSVDRHARHPLAASPGELLAGVIGATFAWLSAEDLLSAGTPARELSASVTLTMSGEGGHGADLVLSAVACHVSARVANIDQEHLEVVSKAAMTRSLQALGMRTDGIALRLDALLESA
jgi:hypothetical protein